LICMEGALGASLPKNDLPLKFSFCVCIAKSGNDSIFQE
jgi:hypothetical protein